MTNTQNEPVEVTEADRDAEILALVILNSDRALAGLPPMPSRENIPDSDGYVVNARAVLDYWNNRPASSTAVDALREAVTNSIDWDEIRQCVESACDEPDADLAWVIDIVRDEIDGQFAALANTPKPNAGLVEELRKRADALLVSNEMPDQAALYSLFNRILSALEGDRP